MFCRLIAENKSVRGKKKLGKDSLEMKIVEQCAPTLAGMKTGSLFNYRFDSADILWEEVRSQNHKLNGKGVSVEVLKLGDRRALLYVYRRKQLEADLRKTGVRELLEGYGYESGLVEDCLEQLKLRLVDYDCFPHEVGVFLGYPIDDVIKFIEEEGRNCKCCGVWKAYCNEREALELFAKFKKCTDVYQKVFAEGRTIIQLTVAA